MKLLIKLFGRSAAVQIARRSRYVATKWQSLPRPVRFATSIGAWIGADYLIDYLITTPDELTVADVLVKQTLFPKAVVGCILAKPADYVPVSAAFLGSGMTLLGSSNDKSALGLNYVVFSNYVIDSMGCTRTVLAPDVAISTLKNSPAILKKIYQATGEDVKSEEILELFGYLKTVASNASNEDDVILDYMGYFVLKSVEILNESLNVN
jgi:hypothetical protein